MIPKCTVLCLLIVAVFGMKTGARGWGNFLSPYNETQKSSMKFVFIEICFFFFRFLIVKFRPKKHLMARSWHEDVVTLDSPLSSYSNYLAKLNKDQQKKAAIIVSNEMGMNGFTLWMFKTTFNCNLA